MDKIRRQISILRLRDSPMILFKYIGFLIGGYAAAFISIFLLFAALGVSGWYIVYIPFLSIIGAVIGYLYYYLKRKNIRTHSGVHLQD
jgi:hypothetical protein